MKPIGNGRTVHESSAVSIATFQVWPHCACFLEHPILIDHRDTPVFNEGSNTKGPLTWSSITSDTSKLNCLFVWQSGNLTATSLRSQQRRKRAFWKAGGTEVRYCRHSISGETSSHEKLEKALLNTCRDPSSESAQRLTRCLQVLQKSCGLRIPQMMTICTPGLSNTADMCIQGCTWQRPAPS